MAEVEPVTPKPRNALGDRATRLLLILATNDRPYPPTVRELRDLSGYRSLAATHRALERLKAAGLVTWEFGKPRTLRALVEVVANEVSYSVAGKVNQ